LDLLRDVAQPSAAILLNPCHQVRVRHKTAISDINLGPAPSEIEFVRQIGHDPLPTTDRQMTCQCAPKPAAHFGDHAQINASRSYQRFPLAV
jgi:hypothetical protein